MSWVKLEQAKQNWEEKLASYEYELSLISSAPQKFELRKRIQECQAEINRLNEQLESTNPINDHSKRNKKLHNFKQESLCRCKRNWELNGVVADDIQQLSNDQSIKILDASDKVLSTKLNIFIGDLGSGKSLIAERFFQSVLEQALQDNNAPIPILFKAPDISNSLLESMKEYSTDIGDIDETGFILIIDEVDRLTQDITSLKESALQLVELYPTSTVALFTRPNKILEPSSNEEHRFNIIDIPELSQKESHYLIQKFSRISSIYLEDISGLTESIKNAIKKPFFAILLGVYFKEYNFNKSDSISKLLSYLVEKKLGNEEVNKLSTQSDLKKLAVKSIEWQGKPVPIHKVVLQGGLQTLLNSKIVIEKDGKLSFPLQIFTEWFAAISISEGYPTPEELIGELQILENWKYPLVMAITTCSHETVSKFLPPIVEKYPIFASEIIDLSLTISTPNLLPSQWKQCGHQLREATQTWINGIKPSLLQQLFPINSEGDLGTVGISLSKNKFRVGWYKENNIQDKVIQLPDESKIDNGWGTRRETQLHSKYKSFYDMNSPDAWAWKYSLDNIKNEIITLLQNRIFTTKDGLMAHEELWETVLIVMNYCGFRNEVSKLRNKYNYYSSNASISLALIEEVLLLFDPKYKSFNNIKREDIEYLRIKINDLMINNNCYLKNPHLSKFFTYDFETKKYVRNCSASEIKKYIEYIFTETINAYKKIVEYLFPNFLEYLYTYSILPAELQGFFDANSNCGIAYTFLVLPSNQQTRVNFNFNKEYFDSFPFEQLDKALYSYRPHRSKLIQNISIIYMHTESVSNLVYDWLWKDLKRINFIEGQLGRPSHHNRKMISEKIII